MTIQFFRSFGTSLVDACYFLKSRLRIKNKVPAESEETKATKFVYDNENYLVVDIERKYWTMVNFKSEQFGGNKVPTTFPSNFVSGLIYKNSENGILNFIPPNSYRIPNQEDFLSIITAAGGLGAWVPIMDNHGIKGHLYEVTDMDVINRLLAPEKWTYANGNNATKFLAQPTIRSVEASIKNESIVLLGKNRQEKIYLEIKSLQNKTGYLRLYVLEKWNNDDDSSFSVRFVKDK